MKKQQEKIKYAYSMWSKPKSDIVSRSEMVRGDTKNSDFGYKCEYCALKARVRADNSMKDEAITATLLLPASATTLCGEVKQSSKQKRQL